MVAVGKDAAGNPKQLWRTVKGTREDATQELTKLLHQRDEGRLASTHSMTLATYLNDQWLPHQRTRIRATTWRRYDSLVRNHILPSLGGVKLQRVRPIDIQQMLDRMISRGLARRSVVQAFRVLSSALAQAVRWQLVTANPASAVRPPRPDSPTNEIPEREDVLRILEAARDTWLVLPLTIAATTGLRRGELLGLRWRDIDLDRRLLHVNGSLQRIDGELRRVDPKTAKARRTVAIPESTCRAIAESRVEQTKRRLLLGEAWLDLDLVVEKGDGSPVDPDHLTHGFSRLSRRLGLNVRLHDLRHAYATTLLKADVHPKIVSEALGHSSTAFTMDTYSAVVPSLQQRAADAISAAFDS